MQNFYRSVALCIVVGTGKMAELVVKYFFLINIERMRGALAVTSKGMRGLAHIDTKRLEAIAENLAIQIAGDAAKLKNKKVFSDRKTTTLEIYRKALAKSMNLLSSD